MLLAVVVIFSSSTNALPLLPVEGNEETWARDVQDIVCAITKLENALKDLPYVELHPCSSVSLNNIHCIINTCLDKTIYI